LDYIGSMTIIQHCTESNCYVSIITCLAMTLKHLEIVSDLKIMTFFMVLRRSFARRGMPKSITSENTPTSTLAENIINE
ncbi:hypothetical protein Angca_001373, partial [Angiostrongylus cantonensis]